MDSMDYCLRQWCNFRRNGSAIQTEGSETSAYIENFKNHHICHGLLSKATVQSPKNCSEQITITNTYVTSIRTDQSKFMYRSFLYVKGIIASVQLK